jgi:hypothetical protein
LVSLWAIKEKTDPKTDLKRERERERERERDPNKEIELGTLGRLRQRQLEK